MNELLKSCVNGGTMNETEAHSIMRDMMTGSLSAAEIEASCPFSPTGEKRLKRLRDLSEPCGSRRKQ